MQAVDQKTMGKTRYQFMLEKFKSFIKEAEDYDPDGPTIILFGESLHEFPNTTLANIETKLPDGAHEGFTMTHKVVERAWNIHREEKAELAKEKKVHPGTVVMIFTDGAPTNEKALEKIIVDIANSVDRDDEFSIGFILVGVIEPNLRQYLDKLDDGLKNVKYDIVGTSDIQDLTFLKAVNNAIHE